MTHDDLLTAMRDGWARLDRAGQDKFFDQFLRAAIKHDRLRLRAWLRRRLQIPPLGLPIDLRNLSLTPGDIAYLEAQSKIPD